jgi:hypothetical protein
LAAVNRCGVPVSETIGPGIVGPMHDLAVVCAQNEVRRNGSTPSTHGSLRGNEAAFGSGRQSNDPIAGPVGVAAGSHQLKA